MNLTTRELIADLTFRSYVFNRRRSPEISPERWRKVYGPGVEDMERSYQAWLQLPGSPGRCISYDGKCPVNGCDRDGECYLWRCAHPHSPAPSLWDV